MKSKIIKLIKLGGGESGFDVPQELMDSGLFLEGDEVEIFVNNHKVIKVRNLSCSVLQVSRFRRNLTGITRKMINPNHRLKRVLVKRKRKLGFVVLPYDEKGDDSV
jgi:hypothetical protein